MPDIVIPSAQMGAADAVLDYCPISREAGLPPRRSIDVSGQQQQQHCLNTEKGAVAASLWHHPQADCSQWSAQSQAETCLVQQPSPQLQQLAASCCSRDVKGLSALLSRSPDHISDAADAFGNTALHLVLLPYVGAQTSPTDTTCKSSSSGKGGPAWLTACFGGSRTAPTVSRAGSMRMLSGTASLQAQQHMVAALLAAGADANARNKAGQTPLMLAVQQLVTACSDSGHSASAALKILEQLCKYPLLDPNAKDNMGRSALHQLCGCMERQSSGSGVLQASTAAASSASISTAAAAAQLKAAQLLLHCAADVNSADKAGMTPLMFAAAQPAVTKDLLQLLLERGANTRQLDNSRRSALTHALLAHNLKLLPAVGAAGAGLSTNEPRSHACSGAGQAAVLDCCKDTHAGSDLTRNTAQHPSTELLIKAAAGLGADAAPAGVQHHEVADRDAAALNAIADALTASTTTTTLSCSACSSSACESYASPDAHAHIHNCSMYSGITTASCSGSCSTLGLPNPRHGSVVRALCSYGALDLHPASINTRFPGKDRLLCVAMWVLVAAFLALAQCIPDFCKAWPRCGMHFVIFATQQAVYRCAFHLLSGLNGFSQLHIAMRRGDVVALQMLLAGGADVNATDSWGNTPLLYWPVAPSEPVELVEELLIKLLSYVSAPDMRGWCCEAYCSVGGASGLPQGAGRTGQSQAACHGSYPSLLLPFAVLSRPEVASADTTGADCRSPTSAVGSLVVVLRHCVTGL